MDTRFFPWIALGGEGRKSGLRSDAVESRGPSRGQVSRRPLGEDKRTSNREAPEGFCLASLYSFLLAQGHLTIIYFFILFFIFWQGLTM